MLIVYVIMFFVFFFHVDKTFNYSFAHIQCIYTSLMLNLIIKFYAMNNVSLVILSECKPIEQSFQKLFIFAGTNLILKEMT